MLVHTHVGSPCQLSWWNYAFTKLQANPEASLQECLDTAEEHAMAYIKRVKSTLGLVCPLPTCCKLVLTCGP